jgi:nitrate reductase gamma subunit
MLEFAFMLRFRTGLLSFALIFAAFATPVAAQSWLVDAGKFHISAHGQLTCATCHGEAATNKLHPDPRTVNERPKAAAAAEGCYGCHDGVRTGLARGNHAGMTGQKAADFADCVSCHDPHTVVKSADAATRHVTQEKKPQEQCGACHAAKKALPKAAADDATCAGCHIAPAETSAAGREKLTALCFHCHEAGNTPAQKITGGSVGLIDRAAYRRTPHSRQSCLECHAGATAYGHANRPATNCTACHEPHYDKAGDPHIGGDCKACHVTGGTVTRATTGKLEWRKGAAAPGRLSQTHSALREPAKAECAKCHFAGNTFNVASTALPAKSVMCMPCHTASLTVNDAATIPALVIFILGMAAAVMYWMTGRREKGGHGWQAGAVAKALVMDGLLQRRLFRQSRTRGAIHLLIFLPFVLRFLWGAAALILSHVGHGTWFLFLVDKNHPAAALFFDVTGVAVIVGVGGAVARAMRGSRVSGLPSKDYAALALIGSVVLMGFVVEAARIAMTGSTGAWAFAGYGLSLAIPAGVALNGIYVWVWYLHAALTGAFVAYLPFSRMFHIVVAPIAIAARAAKVSGHRSHDLSPRGASGD